jgi:pimeloyl-ACP methyl ester carboxylesterase
MPRTLVRLGLTLLLVLTGVWLVSAPATADPEVVDPLAGTPIKAIYLRPPHQVPASNRPVQVLVALHGMGGNGPDFARDLVDQADRFGWMIVAPTIDYGDWTNPDVVAQEDPRLISALSAYLDGLPQLVNAPVRRLVLILGHSRGAQLAHRFAEFRPDRVLGVAALSAGTYTLPEDFQFPYGVQDLDRYSGQPFDADRFDHVAFWVGVGGLDTNPNDLPRQWDGIEGSTRVQRAQTFEAAVEQQGAKAELQVFNNTRHELTQEMRSAACEFLQSSVAAQAPQRDLLSIDVR